MTPEEAIRRQKELSSNRNNMASHWQELANWCLPRKASIIEKRVSGQQLDFHRLFDNTAITSLKIMGAGFHSHLTNPAAEWFEFKMKEKTLNTIKDVKVWLKDVVDVIFNTLNTSNFDGTMQEFHQDSGCFGTGSIFTEEDIKTKVRFTMLPIGETFIEEDAQGRVNRIFRKFQYSVQQAFDRWGDDAGVTVMKAMQEKKYDQMVDLLHWIIPREKRIAGKKDNLNMSFESKWVEIKSVHLIKESGFQEFPVATGRFWKQTGEPWGFSPAMDVLASIRMVNAEKKVTIRGAFKQVDPPISLPSRGFIMPLNMNASGINYRNPQTKADDLQFIQTRGNIGIGLEMIQDVKREIEEGFYVPLFKAFSQITKQMTIPEVQRRIAENMALLGPVVGRFTQEVLDPIIIRTFNILLRGGHLPPPPAILEGKEFDIVYISQLAKAQRATEIVSLEKAMTTVGEVSKVIPSVIDKIDGDKLTDIIWDVNGANPEVLRDEEGVAAIRETIAQAAEKAQQQTDLAQAAETAEKISQTEKNLQPAGAKK